MKSFAGYENYGLRQEWLSEFLKSPERWISDAGNTLLTPLQFESAKKWFYEAELLNKIEEEIKYIYYYSYVPSKLSEIFSSLSNFNGNFGHSEKIFIWGVIWCNLALNSNLVKWFIEKFEWQTYYPKEKIFSLMDKKYTLSTQKSAFFSLKELFTKTPLGEHFNLAKFEIEKREIKGFHKLGIREDLCNQGLALTVLYCLYKMKTLVDTNILYLNTVQKIYCLIL